LDDVGRVKLAIELSTGQKVAIKFMRVKNMVRKKDCLDCLLQEINILTECRHPNIVKILDASFDGQIEHRRF
jgi:serine/threonine protein kinase